MSTESEDLKKAPNLERGLSVSLLATSAQQGKPKTPVSLTCGQCRWSIGTNIPNELLCQQTMSKAYKTCERLEYEPGTVL